MPYDSTQEIYLEEEKESDEETSSEKELSAEFLRQYSNYRWDWRKRMWDAMMTAGMIDADSELTFDELIGYE